MSSDVSVVLKKDSPPRVHYPSLWSKGEKLSDEQIDYLVQLFTYYFCERSEKIEVLQTLAKHKEISLVQGLIKEILM